MRTRGKELGWGGFIGEKSWEMFGLGRVGGGKG